MREHWCCLLVLLVGVAGCGRKQSVRLPPPVPALVGAAEEGIASWYGHPYHGRRTSSGEVYDMDQMTAAHLRLPFGTRVRVTNLNNGRTTEVRITDRGPFVKKRIIDLSRAAAREIAMIGPGTARVRVEVVAAPPVPKPAAVPPQPPAGKAVASVHTGQMGIPPPIVPSTDSEDLPCDVPYFGIQVGSFENFENAMRLQGKMMDRHGIADIVPLRSPQGSIYRVIVGRERDSARAGALLSKLRDHRIDGFITRIDGNSTVDCL